MVLAAGLFRVAMVLVSGIPHLAFCGTAQPEILAQPDMDASGACHPERPDPHASVGGQVADPIRCPGDRGQALPLERAATEMAAFLLGNHRVADLR